MCSGLDRALNSALLLADVEALKKVIGILLSSKPWRYKPEEVIRFATLVCPKKKKTFLVLPFQLLKERTKIMHGVRRKLVRRIAKDSLGSVALLLKQTTEHFKEFVKLAKLCLRLFALATTKKDTESLSTMFERTCLACRNIFFCETTGLYLTIENYQKQMSNVDSEVLALFERHLGEERMYVDCCFQNFEKMSNKV